jgi:hypothetical protein
MAVAVYANFEPCGRFPMDLKLDDSRGRVQDKTHEEESDVDVLEYHEENLTRGKSSINITHTARQNNKNQKEISL